MKKEKHEVSIVRSSAAEYLTFITATGKSDVNAVYFGENSVIRKFRITAANSKIYNNGAEQFEGVLRLSRKEILTNAGSISAKIAEQHALSEFEKYRVRQDRLYQSDFDRMLSGEVEMIRPSDNNSNVEITDLETKKGGKDV